MKRDEFEGIIESMRESGDAILIGKGREYTRNAEDVLANFKRGARERTRIDAIDVWATYFSKHIDSIMNYVEERKESSKEKIESRILDAINYLYLFGALVTESKDNRDLVYYRFSGVKEDETCQKAEKIEVQLQVVEQRVEIKSIEEAKEKIDELVINKMYMLEVHFKDDRESKVFLGTVIKRDILYFDTTEYLYVHFCEYDKRVAARDLVETNEKEFIFDFEHNIKELIFITRSGATCAKK